MSRIGLRLSIAALASATLALGAAPASADDAVETRVLVDKAKATVERFASDPAMDGFRDAVKRARGVFVAPQVLRGAFILGISGGSGVLLTRDEKTGQWGGPVFYAIGEVSFGLQAGGDASEMILLAMTDRGVTNLLSTSAKLGADASVAGGPVGAGVKAATAGLSVDIIAFTLAKGLYGGVSVDGAIVGIRDGWNHAYYGREVSPTDILIRRQWVATHAAPLREAIVKVAGGK